MSLDQPLANRSSDLDKNPLLRDLSQVRCMELCQVLWGTLHIMSPTRFLGICLNQETNKLNSSAIKGDDFPINLNHDFQGSGEQGSVVIIYPDQIHHRKTWATASVGPELPMKVKGPSKVIWPLSRPVPPEPSELDFFRSFRTFGFTSRHMSCRFTG